jgi:hypothetical protein
MGTITARYQQNFRKFLIHINENLTKHCKPESRLGIQSEAGKTIWVYEKLESDGISDGQTKNLCGRWVSLIGYRRKLISEVEDKLKEYTQNPGKKQIGIKVMREKMEEKEDKSKGTNGIPGGP